MTTEIALKDGLDCLNALQEDLACVFDRDPAARNRFEILTLYPGFHAVLAQRLATVFQMAGAGSGEYRSPVYGH